MTDDERAVIMQEAKVRIRAKAFANRLRSEGWAEWIPQADMDWLKDSEIQAYKDTLAAHGCKQRLDFRWERK